VKLIHAVVSSRGFRDPAGNPERVGLLTALIGLAARSDARLLLVPAGFLTARSEAEVLGLVEDVDRLAGKADVAVIGGVDVSGPAPKRGQDAENMVRGGRLPFFGFAVGPVRFPEGGEHPWRQSSIDNSHAEMVPDRAVPSAGRLVAVDDTRVGVLVCGELFSRRARHGLVEAGPHLAVDVGHSGMGQGLIPAMRSLAKAGSCWVAHSQHLGGWYGRSLHFVDRGGGRLSVGADEDRVVEHESLWAAWAPREVFPP
jgi:hypothetical protein